MLKQRMKLQQKVEIFDEVLAFSYKSKNDKMRKAPLIDTRTDELLHQRQRCRNWLATIKKSIWICSLRRDLQKLLQEVLFFQRTISQELQE